MHLGGFQKGAEEWCSGGCRECGSKCVSVRVCVCENFWRCWRCKREFGGCLGFPSVSLHRWQIACAAFYVGFPHTHRRTHIIHMCQMLYSVHTHTDISTHSHTRHMSLFVLVCCRDKTRLCYTPLQERQRTLISHTVCVCVRMRECVCVWCVLLWECFSDAVILFFASFTSWIFSVISWNISSFLFFFPQPDGLIAFCVFVCVRVYTSVWQRHICVPTGPPGPAWHTSLQKWANDTQVAGRHTLKSSRKMLLMI